MTECRNDSVTGFEEDEIDAHSYNPALEEMERAIADDNQDYLGQLIANEMVKSIFTTT